MSDFRAVAAMTRTLQNMLQDAVADIQGAHVRTGRPEKDAPEHRHGQINIFLYQVHENPSWRNMDLPTRRGDGSVIQRPQAALDLSYLLSFYGDEERQVPQLLLGKAVTTLHTWPHPLPRYLPHPQADGNGSATDDVFDLAGSGLGDQLHLLRFTPISLTHDELSKLWTIFFQVPYALSFPIQVSVVLMQPDGVEPEPVLPVRQPLVYDISRTLPTIDQVVPQVLEPAPGAYLMLRGRNLGGPGARVSISGRDAQILAETGGSLRVELPADLPAGSHMVAMTRDVEMGNPPRPHRIFGSNPASFVLQPKVESVAYHAGDPGEEPEGAVAALRLQPPIEPGQRVSLLLNELDAAGPKPQNYTLAPVPEAQGDEVAFSVGGVTTGSYLVRVTVDGVSSRLGTDPDPQSPTFDRYDRPLLEIP